MFYVQLKYKHLKCMYIFFILYSIYVIEPDFIISLTLAWTPCDNLNKPLVGKLNYRVWK